MDQTSLLSLIHNDGVSAIEARIAGRRMLIEPTMLEAVTGWHRRPEGLCRGEVCVPVRDTAAIDGPDGTVDLVGVAALLGRPFVVDAEAGTAYLGEAALDRAAMLRSQVAPEFTLPDLAGRHHSLSEHRGKKVFFVAWASW